MKKFLLVPLFIIISSMSFSGIESPIPKIRLESGVGYPLIFSGRDYLKNASFHLSVMPEWRANITSNFDISFGPKFTILGVAGTDYGYALSAKFETDLNAKVVDNNKIYLGLEVGGGFQHRHYYIYNGMVILPEIDINLVVGAKINDKVNVGVHVGVGDLGLLGLRAGYTF